MPIASNVTLALAILLFAPLAALVLLGLALVPTYLLRAFFSWKEMRRLRVRPDGLRIRGSELETALWNLDERDFSMQDQRSPEKRAS